MRGRFIVFFRVEHALDVDTVTQSAAHHKLLHSSVFRRLGTVKHCSKVFLRQLHGAFDQLYIVGHFRAFERVNVRNARDPAINKMLHRRVTIGNGGVTLCGKLAHALSKCVRLVDFRVLRGEIVAFVLRRLDADTVISHGAFEFGYKVCHCISLSAVFPAV